MVFSFFIVKMSYFNQKPPIQEKCSKSMTSTFLVLHSLSNLLVDLLTKLITLYSI